MSSLDTLVSDIENVLNNGVEDTSLIDKKIDDLKEIIKHRLSKASREELPRLRMSNLGSPCDRKLWFSINKPGEGEPLTPKTRLKFLEGDIYEWVILLLAELAGHRVEGQQTELDIDGVKGHRDAVIDGTTVDVKTASKYGFKKFKENSVPKDDPFGYMDQLGSYRYADLSNLEDKDTVAFLAVNKDSGEIVLDRYKLEDKDYHKIVADKKNMLNQPSPPKRSFDPIPAGVSGNMKLPVVCSYCDQKFNCHENLRAFAYSTGPVYLTKVNKEPDVPEIK